MRKNNWMMATLIALTLMSQVAMAAPSKKPKTKGGAAFDAALLKPAALKAKAPETYKAKFSTTRGDFTLSITRSWAPLGADRFYNLVKNHYYDNASFFRVLPGFMAQFGISATPAVSAAWKNTNLKDDAVTQSNRRGRISFATAGPNTRTTQVFINTGNNARLDTIGFAPFGEVDEAGMAVVEALYSGYGEGAPQGNGPNQQLMEGQGRHYLDKGWPLLDRINTAKIVGEAAAAARGSKKKAAK